MPVISEIIRGGWTRDHTLSCWNWWWPQGRLVLLMLVLLMLVLLMLLMLVLLMLVLLMLVLFLQLGRLVWKKLVLIPSKSEAVSYNPLKLPNLPISNARSHMRTPSYIH